MQHIVIYCVLSFLGFYNGVIGMSLLLSANFTGLINLGFAVFLNNLAMKHREPAHMIMAIKRAGQIVSKMQLPGMSEKDITSIFYIELKAEMLRRKIDNAEAKADSLAKDFKKDQF